jgi:DNA (cytosine-5)-methyltransferase 1
MTVSIIDLFAGPGGLGEGFCQVGWREGSPFFRIGLSVEKEATAHKTLRLRSFLRQFPYDQLPAEYFEYLRAGRNPEGLYQLPQYKEQTLASKLEAWNEELRTDKKFNAQLDKRIKTALKGRKDWVLIGGPPCQAYSLVGRSRNMGIKDYVAEKDDKHFLYKEYLRIISVHNPAVFVMENVKGILSAKLHGERIFPQIQKDLAASGEKSGTRYRIFSLVSEPENYDTNGNPVFEDSDFVIKTERYGVPQARHRVILLGVREDLWGKAVPRILESTDSVPIKDILNLPKLRSGISRGSYDAKDWRDAVRSFPEAAFPSIRKLAGSAVEQKVKAVLKTISASGNRGDEFVSQVSKPLKNEGLSAWLLDSRAGGAFNHTSRSHIVGDLHRYLYAACFASQKGTSPKMAEFPEALKPAHKNRDSGHFADRFRVQVIDQPAKTITSHISKDGHYYIHPDPEQCRSLTVREAARIQTFPDNYFFCGNRTSQYVQVGNAVPPLLANQIAIVVKDLLKEAFGAID